jgi:hypothetical protein
LESPKPVEMQREKLHVSEVRGKMSPRAPKIIKCNSGAQGGGQAQAKCINMNQAASHGFRKRYRHPSSSDDPITAHSNHTEQWAVTREECENGTEKAEQ